MTGPTEQIIKTDVLGRVKTPSARPRLNALEAGGNPDSESGLNEFERSGLSGRKFAELSGVNYQTFATWAQKRRRLRGSYKGRKPGPDGGGTPNTCLL